MDQPNDPKRYPIGTPLTREIIQEIADGLLSAFRQQSAIAMERLCEQLIRGVAVAPTHAMTKDAVAMILREVCRRHKDELSRFKILQPKTEEELKFFQTMMEGFSAPEKPGRED